jgi:hypothetical protein
MILYQYSLLVKVCACSRIECIYQLYHHLRQEVHFNEDSNQLLSQQLCVLRISPKVAHRFKGSKPSIYCHFRQKQAVSHQKTTLGRKPLACVQLIFKRSYC